MKTEVVHLGDSLVVCPEIENLDAYVVSEFKSEVNALIAGVSGHVVLDLHHIGFVDSAGLGAILSVMRLVRGRDKRLVVCGTTPPVRSLFELVRIHKVMDICNTREEAARLVSAA
jgi:anti-sigma B factor antagonist